MNRSGHTITRWLLGMIAALSMVTYACPTKTDNGSDVVDNGNNVTDNDGNGGTEDSIVCQPDCTGKECGDNGCGWICGTCELLKTCQDGQCVYEDGIVWDKSFGGSDTDYVYSIQQTMDGGYIVAGETYSNGAGHTDAWVLRLASNGRLIWDKTFGGSYSGGAYSIRQTTDGGYIVAGYIYGKGAGQEDAWVLRLTSDGTLLWDKTFGGENDDAAMSIRQTKGGGYIVAGYTKSKGEGSYDAWVLKLASSGILLWDKAFGGSDEDQANSIQQTSDGGYIVAGHTASKGAGWLDAWVLKLDSDGIPVWDKTFGGSKWDAANSVRQTRDGGYIVAGYTVSKGAGGGDAWVLRLDSDGTSVWEKTFGGSDYDEAKDIQQTTDGDYIVAGSTKSKGAGKSDAWILKLASDGSHVWDKTFGGNHDDGAWSIQQTQDGGYIVAGNTESKSEGSEDAWVLKLQ